MMRTMMMSTWRMLQLDLDLEEEPTMIIMEEYVIVWLWVVELDVQIPRVLTSSHFMKPSCKQLFLSNNI
jgi:hypothetical protein